MISCACVENESGGNITRIQSLRRSFRNSFRRRRTTGRSSVRTRNTITDEKDSAPDKKRRPRASSEPASAVVADPTDGMPLSREQQGVINDLLLAETYVTGKEQPSHFMNSLRTTVKLVHILFYLTQAQVRWSHACLLQLLAL